jgi:hypothetical protein
VTTAQVATLAIAAGLSAGLAVFCWPLRRPDSDPVKRLARLTHLTSAEDVVNPARRFRLRLQTPWSGSREQRRRGTETARLAPLAADLLAACLASGATPARASEAVATAIRPPGRLLTSADEAAFELANRFQEVAALLRLGGNPVTSWRPLGAEPGLLPVAQAAARACLSGAPPAEAVGWAADDLRSTRHTRGTAAARQAGVRAVAPLTGCFFPAFLLIGVIPIAIGLATRLLP